jgi:hypothetical protein
MTVADRKSDIVVRPSGSRRAVTLVEMVISLGITSIILCACGSAMLLATRALSISAAGPTVSTAVAAAAADQVAADLRMAVRITERTATAVTFTVPDRNEDSAPETLRYAWAGPGSPLTRQYNGQPVPAASIADNVQLFNLDWLLKTTGPPPPVEGPEQLLASRDWPTSADRSDYWIESYAWATEYFQPSLPANAISWKITRVKVKLARNGIKTGTMTIQMKYANSSKKPTGSALDSGSIDVVSLSTTFTWVEFPFSALAGLDCAKAMCAVVTTTQAMPGLVEYDRQGPAANMLWFVSNDQGSSWTKGKGEKVMQIYVYGTVTTQP